MRLTILFLLTAALQVSAAGYGQQITLRVKDATLEKVFAEIEKQTGYFFTYTREQVRSAKKVTLAVSNADITTVLDLCMKGQSLTYQIMHNAVIIREAKRDPELEKLLPPLIKVKGRVTYESGDPVPGASVSVKGNPTLGTTTNTDGFFELEGVDAAATLVISGVSIETQEVPVKAREFIAITARVKIVEQEAVVVSTGYWTTTKMESTGSSGKVTAATIDKQPVLNPIAALHGRITGVYVQQTTGIPGGDFKIEIRGRNNLRAEGNEPLYIVDGVPFSSEKVSSSLTAGGILGSGASPLNGLNNADIESIEILKDADATAIYGSRGANGVVLITTKKGKAGKTKLSIDIYRGGGKAPMVKLLNTKQYLEMRREAFANDGLTPSADPNDNGTAATNYRAYAPDLMLWDTTRYTNWQKTLIGNTANSTSIQASLSGGSEGTQFLFSAGYRKETTPFLADFAFEKASSHFSLNHLSPDKKLNLNLAISGTVDKNNQTEIDIVNRSRVLAPNAPVLYNPDGSLNWENSTWVNPLSALRGTKYLGKTATFVSNLVIGYKIVKNLELKSSFGFTQVQSKERTTVPSTIFDPAKLVSSKNSTVRDARGTNNSWIIEPQLNYEEEIGIGTLTALVGASLQDQQFERRGDTYTEFPSNSFLNNLPTAAVKRNNEFVTSYYRYAAIFGRLNYNIDKKYIINLTGRRDGSSRFGTGRQFANFGALGLAWIFSKEKFLDKTSWLSFGKIRASYGTTGNDQIGNYQYLDTYTAATGNTQYDDIIGLNPTRLFNPEFSWEENRKMEVALEMGVFKDRINFILAYYRNRSSNQLLLYALPLSTGFGNILSNFPATIQNSGLELDFNTVNMQKKNFRWTSSFNVTIPQNKLVDFPNIESSTYANQYIVGQSVYIRKFYELTGVDPNSGLYVYRDVNSDGKITSPDDDVKAIAINQTLFGGFNNSVTYKNWSLDVFFQFVKQLGYGTQNSVLGFPYNQPAFMYEQTRWQKPGDIANVQQLRTEYNPAVAGGFFMDYYGQSDAIVTDASFIRCKNVSLAYQFSNSLIKGVTGRAYLQAQNLFVITKYKGFDPESQATRLAPLRMLTAGLQFSF